MQDIAAGNGFAVLDPHGDLIDDILARMPKERVGDVIVFDPADEAYPVGFNILSAHSELERTLLASDLVAVFKRLSTSFGDQMVAVPGNAILAFLESTEGGTLLDLRRFLIDKSFRAHFLETVQDEQVVSYWQEEFTLLKGLPRAPVLTRLNIFLRSKLIRHMVAQKEDRLDMRAIMDGKRILLAKLSQGEIGAEISHLLGSLIVAKIAQAAMSRQDEAAKNRVPFFLYIDEFHHFITPSLAAILSGARKYGLGLTLAHQEMRQLKSRSEEVASAGLGNAHTRVVFRVGDQDAKTLADGFSFFEAKDLQNLGIGEAIARIELRRGASSRRVVLDSRRRACASKGCRSEKVAPTPDSTSNFGLKQLAMGAGGLLVFSLVDPPIARSLHFDTSPAGLQLDRQLDRFGDETGTIPIVGGLALVGVVTKNRAVMHAALHAAESAVLADLVVQGSKYLVGRSRPNADPDLDAVDFHTFAGSIPAFPSGHTANAFALATSLSDAAGKKWITVGLYALATGTAYARLSEQQHWLSDVIAGAAVGIGSAKFVSGKLKIFGLRAPMVIIGEKSAGVSWTF